MKPYGVKRKDRGCCPGHDKFPCTQTKHRYASRRSDKAASRDRSLPHKRARLVAKSALRKFLREGVRDL